VSTSSYQFEGDNHNSQWAAWEKAGRINLGYRCGLACDWWHNAEDDFDRAKEMGINALRLSVEWSRVEPREGEWDREAIARYKQMLRGLRQRGIQPIVTLHHFSHPWWFEQKGAFLSPDAERLFERFTRCVVGECGELCQFWVTFNEPNVYGALGYVVGEFPPGQKAQVVNALRAQASMGRAHAAAYYAIHEMQPTSQVGWAQNYLVFQPANPTSRLDRWVAALTSELFNESFMKLVEHGRLPFPLNLADGDVRRVAGTCDFVGLNVYSRFNVAFDTSYASQLFGRVFVPPGVPQGDHGAENPYGEAYPPAISVGVKRATRMGKPIYILENGVPDSEDRIRPWVLVNAVRELRTLLSEGYDVRGYFHWSLTDNFEWSEGWGLRFGLYSVDPQTQERRIRRSGELYRKIVKSNGLSVEMAREFANPPIAARDFPIRV
jgi:beta-glucosidase